MKSVAEHLPSLRSVKVVEQLRERIRYRHYSIRTEQAHVHSVRAYIRFHECDGKSLLTGVELPGILLSGLGRPHVLK